MKTLKLTLGVVCLFFLTNTFCFAQSPTMLKDNYQIMPVIPSSSDKFSTPQEAVKEENLPVIVGEAKVELDSNAVKLLSQEANKVNLEYIGTDEKIQLTYNNNSIVIEYGGTKLTIDSNVKVGKIVVDENGLNVYDQAGNLIASLSKAGGGTAFIEGMSINFAKGANVTLRGGDGKTNPIDGKVGAIEVTTAAGTYKIERMMVLTCQAIGCPPGGTFIKITTPSGDTFTFNPKDFNVKSILISADGSAVMKVRHLSMDMDSLTGGSNKNGGVYIKFDSQGKATSVIVYDAKGQAHEISLARDGVVMGDSETIKLNFTVNADLSVSIGSDAANSVRLNFKQDGSIEAVKPDGTVVPIQGDVKNATFHDDGSLAIGFKDGSIIIINPGQRPPLPDGWDKWTPQQRGDWLKAEIASGDATRIKNAQGIFASLDTEEQGALLLILSQERNPTAAIALLQGLDEQTRNKLFVGLAKTDTSAALRILVNWPGAVVGTEVNAEVMSMFKALVDADPKLAGEVLIKVSDDFVRNYKVVGLIFHNLSATYQAKILTALMDPYNPDVDSKEYKFAIGLFTQTLTYDQQLAVLQELSNDEYYPTAATHILKNLDATLRNKLFVDLAKTDALAASRIIAHWPTGLNTPEGYEMFGALLAVDKDAANAVLAALDADPVRAYFAQALRDHFNLPDASWWDGMTIEQIISTLANLVGEKKLDEAAQKLSELAGADLDLAAQVMQGMKTDTAAQIVNKLDVGLAVDILNKVDAKKVAEILTARTVSMLEVYPIPPVISADKAGQILAAMDKGKAADVLEAMKPGDTIPIIKAMLNGQGVQVVADIMKLMDPKKVAAIMAVPYVPFSELSGSGLSVKECADILKAMGGLKNRVALKILINLFRLNLTKGIAVLRELLRRKIPA